MASKFQNRLVGTIVLVALGVIVLPMIFDGDKKYNEEQFAAIPLVPKPGDEEDIDSIPPLTQNMPSTPPEGAAEAMQSQEQEPDIEMLSRPSPAEPITAPPVTVTQAPKKVEPSPSPQQKAVTKPKPEPTEQAPQATAYVVQLGALKNADKVDEIVARLRLSGHQVYTVPSSPVQGQLTRIYVGPNASRQALESIVPELKELTGLQGQIKNYKP
ncbi:cell division protein DedD [Xenorhabdus griffiniae]|uniref:Cell division protein DedD n=1 Tax=Xenorhabdus griffiniae TaxID=351672 RepID=A0ABY9XLE1_9GAMM|nr:cell division protein DedD [Xenorhabdus griffiniae]MBD1226928.1 cell division protein DedD [Xenorhabdus griffiniae]MBE8586093.1 cell division protein DedD [Xenorhabdus griffiniae]WMV73737.1 cell division protein DedD [Xenorhabdus griffiniae]WNH03418.1 cell division protein DedD [Xenorhabdus griffiniae]